MGNAIEKKRADAAQLDAENWARRCAVADDRVEQLEDQLLSARAEGYTQGVRDAAKLVASTAYTSSGDKRTLEPVATSMVGVDKHHATIADAILALLDTDTPAPPNA